MSDKVFLNDKLVEVEQAHIPVTDSGFLYGAGLFETMRSRQRRSKRHSVRCPGHSPYQRDRPEQWLVGAATPDRGLR